MIATSIILMSLAVSVNDPSAALVGAIEAQEGGKWSNVNHHDGAGGSSRGGLQIKAGTIKDVNKRYGTHFTTADAHVPATARRICILYLRMWGEHYKEHTGKNPTSDTYARIWCGGPEGWRKSCTNPYAAQVKRRMTRK